MQLQNTTSVMLTTDEAEDMTAYAVGIYDDVAANVAELSRTILKLYEGEAWKALAYPSWRAYGTDRFGKSQGQIYALLNQAKIERYIEVSAPAEKPTRSAIRESARQPKDIRETVIDAIVESGQPITESTVVSTGRTFGFGGGPRGIPLTKSAQAAGKTHIPTKRHCDTCTCH